MRSCYFTLMLLMLLWTISCSEKPSNGKQVLITEGYSHRVVDGYWLYLPRSFDPARKWPVILFLSGGHAASSDMRTAKDEGPAKYAQAAISGRQELMIAADSFIIINPHMKAGAKEKRQWYQNSSTIMDILEEVLKQYAGDSNRVYLTGLSRGGHGSWGVAKRQSDRFAAIAPIAGAISCKTGCDDFQHLPMWIVHNMGDHIVDYKYSRQTVDLLETNGEQFYETTGTSLPSDPGARKRIFTSLKREDHDAWTTVYSAPQFYQWLLKHKMKADDA